MPFLTDSEFTDLCEHLIEPGRDNEVTVNLDTISAAQFEKLLEIYPYATGAMLLTDGFEGRSRLQQILINKIIAYQYELLSSEIQGINNPIVKTESNALKFLAEMYGIEFTATPFNYYANIVHYHIELQGLTFNNIGSTVATDKISSFYQNLDQHFRDAVQKFDLVTVRSLLNSGANANQTIDNHNTLTFACQNKNTELVSILLHHAKSMHATHINKINPNLADPSGRRPLDIACELGLTSAVFMLLDSQCEHLANINNDYPLTLACRHGHIEIFFQLQAKFDIPLMLSRLDSNGILDGNLDPWNIVLQQNNHEFIAALLDCYKRIYQINSTEQTEQYRMDLERLHSKASSIGADNCLQIVAMELRRVQSQLHDLSQEQHGQELVHLITWNQSISKIDRSVICSIIALCNRYSIEIQAVTNNIESISVSSQQSTATQPEPPEIEELEEYADNHELDSDDHADDYDDLDDDDDDHQDNVDDRFNPAEHPPTQRLPNSQRHFLPAPITAALNAYGLRLPPNGIPIEPPRFTLAQPDAPDMSPPRPPRAPRLHPSPAPDGENLIPIRLQRQNAFRQRHYFQLRQEQFQPHRRLNPKDIKVTAEFEKIAGMIARSNSGTYNSTRSIALTDAQYRTCALTMFKAIKQGLNGHLGCFATWRSSWVNQPEGSGIAVIEIWALAVLAIYDRHAITGKVLTDEDIANREQTLVNWLVDCQRAYNINNDSGIDNGRDDSVSCVHGVFLRAFLALVGLHDAINIVTNPEQWAAEIAKETLAKFFLNYPDQQRLSASLRINPRYLSIGQNLILQHFYTAATKLVEQAILQQVGLLENNGLLTRRDVDNILRNITALPLPVISQPTLDPISTAVTYENFAIIPLHPNFNDHEPALQQVKLPPSLDTFYIAVILSVMEIVNPTAIPKINSVHVLRNMLANIIEVAFTAPLDQALPFPIPGIGNKFSTMALQKRVKEQLNPDDPDVLDNTKLQTYLTGIRQHAPADALCRGLVAAIYNTPIRLFTFTGEELITITPHALFIRIDMHAKPLNLCQGNTAETETFNALLQMQLWGEEELPHAVEFISRRGHSAQDDMHDPMPTLACFSRARAKRLREETTMTPATELQGGVAVAPTDDNDRANDHDMADESALPLSQYRLQRERENTPGASRRATSSRRLSFL